MSMKNNIEKDSPNETPLEMKNSLVRSKQLEKKPKLSEGTAQDNFFESLEPNPIPFLNEVDQVKNLESDKASHIEPIKNIERKSKKERHGSNRSGFKKGKHTIKVSKTNNRKNLPSLSNHHKTTPLKNAIQNSINKTVLKWKMIDEIQQPHFSVIDSDMEACASNMNTSHINSAFLKWKQNAKSMKHFLLKTVREDTVLSNSSTLNLLSHLQASATNTKDTLETKKLNTFNATSVFQKDFYKNTFKKYKNKESDPNLDTSVNKKVTKTVATSKEKVWNPKSISGEPNEAGAAVNNESMSENILEERCSNIVKVKKLSKNIAADKKMSQLTVEPIYNVINASENSVPISQNLASDKMADDIEHKWIKPEYIARTYSSNKNVPNGKKSKINWTTGKLRSLSSASSHYEPTVAIGAELSTTDNNFINSQSTSKIADGDKQETTKTEATSSVQPPKKNTLKRKKGFTLKKKLNMLESNMCVTSSFYMSSADGKRCKLVRNSHEILDINQKIVNLQDNDFSTPSSIKGSNHFSSDPRPNLEVGERDKSTAAGGFGRFQISRKQSFSLKKTSKELQSNDNMPTVDNKESHMGGNSQQALDPRIDADKNQLTSTLDSQNNGTCTPSSSKDSNNLSPYLEAHPNEGDKSMEELFKKAQVSTKKVSNLGKRRPNEHESNPNVSSMRFIKNIANKNSQMSKENLEALNTGVKVGRKGQRSSTNSEGSEVYTGINDNDAILTENPEITNNEMNIKVSQSGINITHDHESIVSEFLDKSSPPRSKICKSRISKLSFKTQSRRHSCKRKIYPPLKHWLNERLDEYVTPDGTKSFRINPGIKTSEKRRKRKDTRHEKCGVRIPLENGIAVLDPQKNAEVQANIVVPFGSVKWYPVSGTDTYKIKSTIRLPHTGFGFVRLLGYQLKPRQYLKDWDMVFVIVEGDVDVCIHETRTCLSMHDTFMVPCGNWYSIRNLKQSMAVLTYFSSFGSYVGKLASV